MEMWRGLDIFLNVVSEGTFTAAARKSGVSVAHVSRHIGYLEERLGVVLFKRNTRKMVPTERGLYYAKQLQHIRRQLVDLNEQMLGEGTEPAGPIAISCSVGFASRRLTALLARFVKQYPKVNLTVDFSIRNVDLVEDGFDFAVRFGKPGDSSLMARCLNRRPLTLVATPKYLKTHGRPEHPDELANHNCLIAKNRQWRFHDQGEPFSVKVSGNWVSANADALISACLADLGIAYLARDMVQTRLDQGTLESLLSPYCPEDNGTWILYPRIHLPLRVRMLIDYLAEQHRADATDDE